MTKTTNYEISKKLAEIGFKAKAEKCWAKIRHSVLSEIDLVNLDFTVPQHCDEWVLSYDLETLLDALPEIINIGLSRNKNESLADNAGRLLILLHEKNLIKF